MKIQVTEDDIRFGERGECTDCPVARAISRATKREAYVDSYDICSGSYDWFTPEAVRTFIARFDSGQPVEPFTFEL